jgi:hypothetical protein
MHKGVWSENMKVRDHLKYLGVDERISPVLWPGVKNSPNVAHACRKKRLKLAPCLGV